MKTVGPGLRVLARFFMAGALVAAAGAAFAQPATRPRPAQSAAPAAVDNLVMMKLIWSAMAALDHANQTGNYSVLRDLGAPSFQANNSAATLGGTFQALRTQRVDVGSALVVTPSFEIGPTIVEGGLLRARGSFPLRPNPIGFDLLFQNVAGQWKIFGIAVVPLTPQTARAAPQRR